MKAHQSNAVMWSNAITKLVPSDKLGKAKFWSTSWLAFIDWCWLIKFISNLIRLSVNLMWLCCIKIKSDIKVRMIEER